MMSYMWPQILERILQFWNKKGRKNRPLFGIMINIFKKVQSDIHKIVFSHEGIIQMHGFYYVRCGC